MASSETDESNVSPTSESVSTNIPVPTSTPIKKSKPLHTLFSTLTRYRHPTLNSIGNQMIGSIVGPMPVDEFIETFLPQCHIPEYHPATNFQPSVSFRRTLSVEGELAMYAPFIEDMRPFAPQLHFVDSHARGDKHNGYSFEIKPDISIYHSSLGDPPKGCNVSKLDLFVEFKWSSGDDPFIDPLESESRDEIAFVGSSQHQIDTIGQMGAYAAAQLASQFRTHVFSVLVVRDTARIIRWDREGAIVTEPISYDSDSSLVEFFSRFSQVPPELRGVDTTVTEATGNEAASARDKLGLKQDVPLFKTSVPTREDSGSLEIIFAKPPPYPSLPAGRATRACPAYNVSGDCLVFFKDSWRIAANDITPEGKIYADLQEDGVPFVPKCLASGDVGCRDEQKSQTLSHSRSPWACQEGLKLTAHSHYRLVLDIVGASLMDFNTTKELVQAIHDALLAHKEALAVGYLHRDISAGNIIIFNGRGYLIDWDLAKLISVPQPRRASRTGTWHFMSARLVKDSTAHHTFRDDLESAFWVLLWTALMFSKSKLDTESLTTFIRKTFESDPPGEEKRSVLMFQTELTPDLFPDCPVLYPLLKDLADLFNGSYYVSSKAEWDAYRSLKAKLKDSPELLDFNFTHRQITSTERLEDHSYIISCFSRYLSNGDWPSADRAEARTLYGIDSCGGESGMVLLKSKNLLSRVYDEGRRRKRRRIGSSVSSSKAGPSASVS